jgi:hypothetical protein
MAARCIERGGISSCTIKRKIPVLCTPALFFLGFVLYVSELPYSMQIRREASMAFRLGISYVHISFLHHVMEISEERGNF